MDRGSRLAGQPGTGKDDGHDAPGEAEARRDQTPIATLEQRNTRYSTAPDPTYTFPRPLASRMETPTSATVLAARASPPPRHPNRGPPAAAATSRPVTLSHEQTPSNQQQQHQPRSVPSPSQASASSKGRQRFAEVFRSPSHPHHHQYNVKGKQPERDYYIDSSDHYEFPPRDGSAAVEHLVASRVTGEPEDVQANDAGWDSVPAYPRSERRYQDFGADNRQHSVISSSTRPPSSAYGSTSLAPLLISQPSTSRSGGTRPPSSSRSNSATTTNTATGGATSAAAPSSHPSTSSASAPFRAMQSLRRRGSHPLSARTKVKQDADDGEFIKRAFENLQIEPTYRQPPFAAQQRAQHPWQPRPSRSSIDYRSGGEVSLMEMLTHDDPLGVGITSLQQHSANNASRSSLSSTLSNPFSVTGMHGFDRASIRSNRPLLALRGNGNGADNHSGGEGASSDLASSSNNNNHAQALYPRNPMVSGWTANTAVHTNSSTTRAPSIAPTRLSESTTVWSDPFGDDDSRRMRRRSTISGYSITSSDWASLRRGSLVSMESVAAAAVAASNAATVASTGIALVGIPSGRGGGGGGSSGGNGNSVGGSSGSQSPIGPPGTDQESHHHHHHHQQQQPYRKASDAGVSSASRATSLSNFGLANDPFADLAPSSLRWEAWAAAYRESVAASSAVSAAAGQSDSSELRPSTSTLRHHLLQRGPRLSLTSDNLKSSSSSIHELGGNLFYPMRRQFTARTGSRSESNRILIIELCHALEEYTQALAILLEAATPSPSSTGNNDDQQEAAGTPRAEPTAMTSEQPVSSQAAASRGSRAPSLRLRLRRSGESVVAPLSSSSTAAAPPASDVVTGPGRIRKDLMDKSHIHLVANELDSLIREIIEAVPAFSYALGQGSYGPLPFSISTLVVAAATEDHESDIDTRSFLERALSLSESSEEVDLVDVQSWWPVRLKADLTEGLLSDATEDHHHHHTQMTSIHSFSVPLLLSQTSAPRTDTTSASYSYRPEQPREPDTVNLVAAASDPSSSPEDEGERLEEHHPDSFPVSQPPRGGGGGGESDKRDWLLEQGRRRWMEYKAARQSQQQGRRNLG